MNVSVPAEMEQKVEEKVRTGLYTSASEVVREGLRLLFARDEHRALKLEALRRQIAEGDAQLARGEGRPGRAVRERLVERARGRRRS